MVYLIVMGSSNEDDWTGTRNVEGAPRPDFSEEDLGDEFPEHHDGLIGHRRARRALLWLRHGRRRGQKFGSRRWVGVMGRRIKADAVCRPAKQTGNHQVAGFTPSLHASRPKLFVVQRSMVGMYVERINRIHMLKKATKTKQDIKQRTPTESCRAQVVRCPGMPL